MAEKWETVTRSSKKLGSKAHSLKQNGKNHDKKFSEAVAAPLIQEKSAYEALAEKTKKDKPLSTNTKSASDGDANSNKNSSKSAIPRPTKKEGHKKSNVKQTLETLVPSLTGAQFEEVYAKVQQLFKDNPLVCLKELTSQLNSKVDQVPMSDPLHGGKPEDFPASLLPAEVKKVFVKSMKECSPELLKMFLDQLVQSVMTEMAKGLSVYGYQIVAQILAKQRPDIFCLNLQKLMDVITTTKNAPQRCLAVMWIVGQGGLVDFRSGLKVWTYLMLPLFGIKTLSSYAVSYLGAILHKHGKKIETGYGVIEMKEYFLLLDGVFTDNSNLQVPVQKKLKDYYPVLKELAFGRNKSKTLRKFFPSFLSRLTLECENSRLQTEVLTNITLCLNEDGDCFADWKQIYTKHLKQSSVLLNHLADSLKSDNLALNMAEMKNAVSFFNQKNADLSKSAPGLNECKQACQRFDELFAAKAAESVSTTKLVLLLCIVGVVILVGIDSYQSGGFKASTTYRLLKESGVESVAAMILSKVLYMLSVVSNYILKNFPTVLEKTLVYVEPTMELIWKHSIEASQYLLEASQPLRQWLADNIPAYIDWVIMHPIWRDGYDYLLIGWTYIEPHFLTCSDFLNKILHKIQLTVVNFV